MAITTLDGIVAGLLPPFQFVKSSVTTEGAGTWQSLWKVAGLPGSGSNPPAFTAGSGYVPDDSTAGAFPFANPVSGNNYLARFGAAGSVAGTLIIYDRLWACSGLLTNTVSAQTITTPGNPGRVTDYKGVELWGEVYTAPGATGATWTVSYTDQDNNSGATATYTHPANAETVGQMFPFTLAAGDNGVRSVASFTCSVSSGTAGDIGLTLLRRVAELPLTVPNVAAVLDAVAAGFPVLPNDACLALMVQCTAATSGLILGSFNMAQG